MAFLESSMKNFNFTQLIYSMEEIARRSEYNAHIKMYVPKKIILVCWHYVHYSLLLPTSSNHVMEYFCACELKMSKCVVRRCVWFKIIWTKDPSWFTYGAGLKCFRYYYLCTRYVWLIWYIYFTGCCAQVFVFVCTWGQICCEMLEFCSF